MKFFIAVFLSVIGSAYAGYYEGGQIVGHAKEVFSHYGFPELEGAVDADAKKQCRFPQLIRLSEYQFKLNRACSYCEPAFSAKAYFGCGRFISDY